MADLRFQRAAEQAEGAHRALDRRLDLDSVLSRVEVRLVETRVFLGGNRTSLDSSASSFE
jgi:hypothetical protein